MFHLFSSHTGLQRIGTSRSLIDMGVISCSECHVPVTCEDRKGKRLLRKQDAVARQNGIRRRYYMKPESPGHSMQYQHYYSHASSSTALVAEIVIVLRQALEGWFP